jgi:hypothetical protein
MTVTARVAEWVVNRPVGSSDWLARAPATPEGMAAQGRHPLRRARTGPVSPLVYWVPTTLLQPSTMFLIAAEKAPRFEGKCSLA